MINYISHKKSKQIVNGLPKLPTSDQLKEGEIAINYANGYETLSIKNSDNEITTFSSTEQIEKYVDTKLGSGFTGDNSSNTVTSVIEENEKITSASLNELNDRKLDASAYTPTDLSDYYKKEETSGKTEIATALNSKANTSDLSNYYKKAETSGSTQLTTAFYLKADTSALTAHTGNSTIHITSDERTKWNGKISNAQYSKTDKKIYFYSGATTETPVSNIDATDFIKDGMVSSVEIKDVTNTGSCLVITFNVDAGKEDIVIPVSKIFNSNNYYLKSETSGSTQLTTAFGLKANSADLTAHTGNNTIHITADERTKWNNATTTLASHSGNTTVHITTDERTKWNNAVTSSHTHANKAVLDKITAIDSELKADSNNLVVNSAITKVIQDNEKISSAALNELNERKLDASAYTPVTSDEITKWNNAATTLASHTGNTTAHITSDERTKWNGKVSNVQYSKTDKKIYFYSGATTETPISNIDATDFIKDGMVSNVEIKDVTSSGSCLVITFNADSGKQDINIPVSKIFNPANYYLKSETSGKTELDAAFGKKANASDLSNYYKKTETSGSTQLTTAFNSKANTSDLTDHTSDSTIHITADERTKWDNAATSSHTHANKDVLDKITAIDTELSETSKNLVVNSAITKVIVANEKISSSALNELNDRKLDASAYTPTDLSDYYKKEETSGKTELDTALNLKANASNLTAHTGNSTVHITSDERTKWNRKISNAQYSSADKKIYFYSGATTEAPVSNIDATDFIKDGMVSNVEIKDVTSSGSCLVITFNADAGKQDIIIPVSKIFNPANYYLKSETSGKTELDTAFNSKANSADLTAHTGNSTIHITADERTKWNNAVASSHTHANKAVLDKITAIDTELSEASNNLVVNSAITKVIQDNEKISSAALNELNERKLDASAYTPTDLSDYYKKEETSGKTELDEALKLKANSTDLATKANTADLTAHTGNSTIHITSDERTKWNNAATTLASHSGNATVHITSAERTKWNGKISNVQYNKTDKKIYFYSGATTGTPVSNIDATDFIKDGMVSNVEIKDVTSSGSCLVITFNADAGKQNIVIPVSKIFNPANYYLKSETSGKTEISTALSSKANATDLTSHTGDKTVHITADERTKWNNAATSSHTHSNKAVLDKITAIDTELSETSNNLVVNSAITKVIVANEKIASASLNELNERKLDASAYTPTDLSDYYKKEETSGKSEITTALNLKANTSELTAHTGNATVHITSAERTKWNDAATSSHTHANKAVLDKITAIDSELKADSNNLVVNSAITKVIEDNERIASASLNDLNERKLDASAYTPTDLSDYYKKEDTSGKTEIAAALNSKANTGHTHLSSAITDRVTGITESNSGSTSVPTVSAVMQVFKDNEETISSALNDLNDRIKQLDALIKKYDTRITALENK